MRRIDLTTGATDAHDKPRGRGVVLHGETPDGELRVSSRDDITFPAVWVAGERVYDVEVWQDGELVATVPPQSTEVDASFDEHERMTRSGE